MCDKVISDWLKNYIKDTQPILGVLKIIEVNYTHKKKTSQLNALCLLSIVYVYGEKKLSNNLLIKKLNLL